MPSQHDGPDGMSLELSLQIEVARCVELSPNLGDERGQAAAV
jgi:hypothetical protein